MRRFWIGVASKEHVDYGVRYGFLEIDQESFEIIAKGMLDEKFYFS